MTATPWQLPDLNCGPLRLQDIAPSLAAGLENRTRIPQALHPPGQRTAGCAGIRPVAGASRVPPASYSPSPAAKATATRGPGRSRLRIAFARLRHEASLLTQPAPPAATQRTAAPVSVHRPPARVGPSLTPPPVFRQPRTRLRLLPRALPRRSPAPARSSFPQSDDHRELDIRKGDGADRPPAGMSCGCPITHCGVVAANHRTGVMTCASPGRWARAPMATRTWGLLHRRAYEVSHGTQSELRIGRAHFFQPRHVAMLQVAPQRD